MSENWPHFGSEENAEPGEAGSSSTNGASPEDADGAPEGAAEGNVATIAEATDEAPTATEISGETSSAGAAEDAPAASDDTSNTSDDTAAASAAPVDIDDGSVFVTELVRAMQTTVGVERARTGEETERRRQAHIDGVRAREASEADRMRELAADDMKAIEAWADGEMKRIQLERERRASELNKDLETSLSEHHAKIDREVETVETAIATYRAEVAVFFESLDREADPILIAQQASKRPAFPALDAVPATDAGSPPAATEDNAAAAATAAPSEPAAVGVMDPQAAAEPAVPWTAPAESSPESATSAESTTSPESAASAESAAPAEPPELVTVPTASSEGTTGPLLQSVPIHRPMSWLRRDANGGDRSNHDG
jgi:hypothetical protein